MALLEVIATSAADAKRAEEGGADRVELVGVMDDGGMSPAPDLIDKVRLATTIQVRPMLRLRPDFGTDGAEVTRMKGLIASYLDAGADGVVLGFLNAANQIDVEVMTELVGGGTVDYTFHRAIDRCLDQQRAWRAVATLPGRLTHVLTAGSALDVDRGLNDIIARAKSDAGLARRIMVGGGLRAEHVPWLVRAGVHAFHIGRPARPGGSYKAYVDPDLVHSWRTLIDDEVAHERRRVASSNQES